MDKYVEPKKNLKKKELYAIQVAESDIRLSNAS